MTTIQPHATSPTTSTSPPHERRALPRHQQQDGRREHGDQQDQGFRGPARQPGARIGEDLLQIDGDRDEHETGEDPRGPGLGQEEVVPFVHLPLPFVWSWGKSRRTGRRTHPVAGEAENWRLWGHQNHQRVQMGSDPSVRARSTVRRSDTSTCPGNLRERMGLTC